MCKPRFVLLTLCLSVFCQCFPALPLRAAQAAAPPARPISLPPNPLALLPYDAAQRGPLLLVGNAAVFRSRAGEAQGSIETLSMLAQALRRQVVPVRTLTVLAPPTMRVIADNPGKPDEYAGLRADERFKVLLSQFSTAQWQRAGSKDGIGLADLNEAQRGLYLSLLPDKMTLQRVKLVPGDKPNVTHYDRQGSPQEADPTTARLRLVRKVVFQFSKVGTEDTAASSSVEPAADTSADEMTILEGSGQARGDARPDAQTTLAYGVPILQTVPNRLKPSQLNFTAPFLQAGVALDGDVKTLAGLLARVAAVTHLDLVADKRIATLPVFTRAAPQQSARAGDILEALCWSVTGAFRRVGTSTYLLTDDVRGIGTRFARLDEWAETASEARYKAMHELTKTAAGHDPLAHIGFAPGDAHGLPPALLQRVDAAYRKERYGAAPAIAPSELPEALQQVFDKDVQYWADNNIPVRTDRVRVGTQLSAQFVLPGDAAVEVPFAQNIGSQYLQEVAALPRSPSAAAQPAAPTAPKPMPDTLRKRVLLARLPEDNKELADLLTLAKAKGFGEVWLRVRLEEATARMKAAVSAGKKTGLAVGAIVSVLHEGGLGVAEDLNLFEETGAQYAKRHAASAPEGMKDYYQRVAGWTLMPDGEEVARRLTPLARMAGLSALTLTATAAPGWAGPSDGGDSIPSNGHLGYTLASRLAYLRAAGVDPLDVTHYSYTLEERADLPFYPGDADELWKELNRFRLQDNKRALAVLYAALQQAAPTLPLYLDDRVSSYGDPNTRWYARWEGAQRIPMNPVYSGESEARAAAFAQSSEPLLCLRGWNGKPESMARLFGNVAQEATRNWRGVTLDLAHLPPAEALRMLSGLPNDVSERR